MFIRRRFQASRNSATYKLKLSPTKIQTKFRYYFHNCTLWYFCYENWTSNFILVKSHLNWIYFQSQGFTPIEQLKSQPWATPEELAVVVKEAQKRIRAHLAPLQRSMQLYLANKETEFILFRPIRVCIEWKIVNTLLNYATRPHI